MPVSIDPQFLKRVYRTTTWVAAILLLFLLTTAKWKIVAGFVVGVCLALGLLKSHEVLVPILVAPRKTEAQGKRKGLPVVGLLILKYAGVGALLWGIFTHQWISPGAFFGGFVLVQAVIFLKVVGLLMMQRMGITNTEK